MLARTVLNALFTLPCNSSWMSRYLRPRIPGASIFFTVTLGERGSTLLTDEIERLRYAVAATRRERPFTIDAMVVLPDHLHCVWTLPVRDCDYSQRWRMIKSRFSMNLPKRKLRDSHVARQERGIWQRRFWEHHLRHNAEFETFIRYCWMNPVRHGLVEQPQDWPFSSWHRDQRMGMVA